MRLACPSCKTHPLDEYEFHNESVDQCHQCGGLWFDSGELNKVLSVVDNDDDNVNIEQQFGEFVHMSERDCPHCSSKLACHHLMDEFQVEVDLCAQCGVWIDRDELDKVKQSPLVKASLQGINKKLSVKSWIFQILSQMPAEYNIKPKSRPWMTYSLLLLNIIIFMAYGFEPQATEFVYSAFALRSNLIMEGQNLWGLWTHMYLHGGMMHLVGNMYFLYIIGDNLEDALGRWRFLALYTVCGFGAAGLQIAMDPTSPIPMMGASGAIAGLFAMYLLWFRHASLSFMFIVYQKKVSPLIFFMIWLATNIYGVYVSDASMGGVAYWAHIGGFFAGLALAFRYKQQVMDANPLLKLLNSSEAQIVR